jgi:Peptidase C13 family
MNDVQAAAMMDHAASQPAGRLGLVRWIREGLRTGFLVQARVAGHQPAPWQLLAVVAGVVLLELALGRLEVPGPAEFDLRGWLIPWWSSGLSALLVWAALWRHRSAASAPRPAGVATWFLLSFVGTVPLLLAGQALNIAHARDAIPSWLASGAVAWTVFIGLIVWGLLIQLWLGVQFGLRRWRLVALTSALFGLSLLGAWHFRDSAWEAIRERDDRPRLSLTQEIFERQQALWQETVQGLAPQRPGVVDVYGLVFAPYAYEDVFLRESDMVAGVLADRFEAQGRVLRLVNHARTADSLPWATPLNLQRAISALAQRMDREQDVLVVYLTSHGASNFRLAAEHWPLQVPGLTPQDLRQALDASGVRHRVIAVSACYSGGWVQPLAGDTTLVMTAADPENTSYGCGRKSELTFFGRAVFHEQLRATHSFEQAFAAAVPVIKRREEEAGKPDGFSNPQIQVGAGIRPVLDELSRRLDGAAKP